MHKNYEKYLKKFGPEANLPGFRLTNQQMIDLISYQTQCYKWQDSGREDGYSDYCFSRKTFNCSGKEYDEYCYEEKEEFDENEEDEEVEKDEEYEER